MVPRQAHPYEEYAWHRLHALEQSGGEPGQGLELTDAVRASKAYVTEAIEHGIELGSGCGPTHHC